MKYIIDSMTKRQIAKITGIDMRRIYKITNYSDIPNAEQRHLIASTFNLSICDLWIPDIFDPIIRQHEEQQTVGQYYGIILPQPKQRVCFSILLKNFGIRWVNRFNMVCEGKAIPNVREYELIKALYSPAQINWLDKLVPKTDFAYTNELSAESKAKRALYVHDMLNHECQEKNITMAEWCKQAHLDPIEVGKWLMGISEPNLPQERQFLQGLGFNLSELARSSYIWNVVEE